MKHPALPQSTPLDRLEDAIAFAIQEAAARKRREAAAAPTIGKIAIAGRRPPEEAHRE